LAYIILASIIIFIFVFVIAVVPVVSNSMAPKLNDGDMTVVWRLSYIFSEPNRGDIVNIKTHDKMRYVKRIVGLPGEKIDYINGILYVNNIETKEEYISSSTITSNFTFEDICSVEDCPNGVIPKDMYLVLGDDREDSKDSRNPSIGLIQKKELKGKVLFKIWPISEISNLY